MACPSDVDLKILPNLYLQKSKKFSPQSPSKSQKYDNYDKATCSFPLLLVTPGKPVQHAIHYPMTNFGPLFDHHLIQGQQEPGTKV